jgi:hypothetical protein
MKSKKTFSTTASCSGPGPSRQATLPTMTGWFMPEVRNSSRLMCAVVLMATVSAAHAVTLQVHCGGSSGLTSIGAAVRALQEEGAGRSNTINVSGACVENVVIQSMDRLTLNALNGASIVDASAGNLSTVTIDDSRDVTLNGFTVSGGLDGVDCLDGSLCRFNGDTVENAAQGAAIFVGADSYALIIGGALQNSAVGLQVSNGSKAKLGGVSVHGNFSGLIVNNGSLVLFFSSSSTANAGPGIQVAHGSTLVCGSCTVTGNSADGIDVAQSSNVTLSPNFGLANPPGYSVTGNGGVGISLESLSGAAFFGAQGSVSPNNGALDVACSPSFSAAPNPPAPARTNCPAGP